MCDACHTTRIQTVQGKRVAAKTHARVASLRQRIHREHILQEIKDLIASHVHERKRLAPTDSGAQEANAAKRPKQSTSVVAPHASSIEPLPSTVPHSRRQTKRQATTETHPKPESKQGKQTTSSAQPHAPTHGHAFNPEVPEAKPAGNQVRGESTRLYDYVCPRCKCPCRSGVQTGRVHHRGKCGHKFRVLDGAVAGRQHEHTCPRCGESNTAHPTARLVLVRHGMLQHKNMARSVPDDQTKSSSPIEPCFVLLAFILLNALVAALLQKHTTRGGPNPRSPIVVVEVVGTPGPATAFPNLILIQNEPPMVALWVPNAASESLEKNKFVSICLGHLGPGHLVPPQLFPI